MSSLLATALCLFRVVQEAAHNIVKHSGAKDASVRISKDGGGLRLQVADAGRGFSLRNTEHTGLGLVSMRERVNYLGGEISVRTADGHGTRIEVRIPVTHDIENGRSLQAKTAVGGVEVAGAAR